MSKRIRIEIPDSASVSGLLDVPASPRALVILAHGAGAGMDHPFLQAVASALAERDFGVLRYQFPYSERGSGRTDPPAIAHAAVRAPSPQPPSAIRCCHYSPAESPSAVA